MGATAIVALEKGSEPSTPKSTARQRGLSWSKKLIVSCLVFVFFVGALEIVCRLLGLGPHERVAHYIANWDVQWDSDFYVAIRGVGTDDRGINRDGVRDREHAIEKPPGVTRVVCLGDSVTFGYGGPHADSYPALLQTKLSRQGHTAEVFSLALPGWSTRQERIAYEKIARKYQPDYVILGICLNDIPEVQNNLTEPPPALLRFLYPRSSLVRWVVGPNAREIKRVEELFEQADTQRVQDGWRRLLDEIRELRREVEADSARLVVLVFPFRFQLLPGAPEAIPQRILRRFCEEENIVFLDPLSDLLESGSDSFLDYDHLSRIGAEVVSDVVMRSGVLQR